MMVAFPHLTDTESVRREAAQQYGGLNDAAALVSSHKASLDPNVEAAALKKINPEETQKVQDDLSLAQAKIDEVHGEGTYRVLDATVRGHALSAVVEDQSGRTKKVAVGWTPQWRSISRRADEAAAALNAEAEAAKGRLGSEARAEIERRVSAAAAEIMADVQKLFAKKTEQVADVHADAVKKAVEDDAGDGEPVGDDVKYPSSHDDLDALAAEHEFTWPDGVEKVKEKQDALREAGIKPEEE